MVLELLPAHAVMGLEIGDGQVIVGGVEVLGYLVGGVTETCPQCGGTGTITKHRTETVTCSKCGGNGRITCPECNGNSKITCPKCNGKGKI
jgi:ribosomal protein S27AE